MTSKIEKFKEEVYKQCIEHEDYDMRISYILSKKEDNGVKSHKAICYSYSDPDQIRTVTEQDNTISYSTTLEWAFNFDEDFLSDLQDNWKIEYMPIEEHYNVWCSVNELRDEIFHTDGLQEYLKYCQKNQIDSNTISLLGLRKVNIMDMYIEKNEKYRIISNTSIGQDTIVLGYNPKASSPYVTWSTSSNRKYGYNQGHYFSSYNNAFKDYKDRCEDLLNRHCDFERNKTKPVKEKIGYER